MGTLNNLDEEPISHKLLSGSAYCGLLWDFDIVLASTWADTTCSSCWFARLKPCKRGHSVGRRRYNSRGNLICMDCVNEASRRWRRGR